MRIQDDWGVRLAEATRMAKKPEFPRWRPVQGQGHRARQRLTALSVFWGRLRGALPTMQSFAEKNEAGASDICGEQAHIMGCWSANRGCVAGCLRGTSSGAS